MANCTGEQAVPATVKNINNQNKMVYTCPRSFPNEFYRQQYTDEQFANLPFLCHYIEEGRKKIIDANLENVNKLSRDEIVPHIEDAFKLERALSGDLRKYVWKVVVPYTLGMS